MKSITFASWWLLSIFWFETGTSTLLSSGLMLNFGLGAYLAKEFISAIFGNPMRTVSTTQITRQDGSIYNSSNQGLESFMAVAEVAKALGLDKRLNRYVKELFDDDAEDDLTEVECLGSKSKSKKCRKLKKKKKRKRKKSKPKDSSEEDEANSINFVDSEEYAPYIIKGDKGEEEMADEILAESDPLSFYYVMKDQKRRERKKPKTLQHQPQMQMPQMSRPQPLFKPGSLPLFFRFRRPMTNNRQY